MINWFTVFNLGEIEWKHITAHHRFFRNRVTDCRRPIVKESLWGHKFSTHSGGLLEIHQCGST